MKLLRKTVLFAPLALALVNACSASNHEIDESELMWGHLDDFSYVSLLNVSPGDEIAICSDEPERDGVRVERALRTWFRAVGYEQHLDFKVDCSRSRSADATVYSLLYPRGALREMCNDNVVGFAYPISNRLGGVVVRCMPEIQRTTHMTSHTMHETGHLMGLCDQYTTDAEGQLIANIGMHESCSEDYRSQRASSSVMNAGGNRTTNLTPDDIAGIRSFALRPEIRTRALWRETLASDQNRQAGRNRTPQPTPSSSLGSAPSSAAPSPTVTTATPTTTTTAPPTNTGSSSRGATGYLDCNRDYSQIRSGGSGICRNESSGFCYRYGSGDVLYDQGRMACH